MDIPDAAELVELTRTRLADAGFFTNSLENITLPDRELAPNGDADPVPFAVYGDLDAPAVIMTAASYLTDANSPHFKLRLAGQQAVVAPEDVCVVSVQAFDPGSHSRADRLKFAKGDFSPLTDRMLRVVEALHFSGALLPMGNSLGGDLAVQLAYETNFNANRGIARVPAAAAIEAARTVDRGAIKVIGAFNASSTGLYDSIIDSGVPSLNEAWGIRDPASGKKPFDSKVQHDATSYMLADIADNLAIMRGFGTDRTAWQLRSLVAHTAIRLLLGREERSRVTPASILESLRSAAPDRVVLDIGTGDHSSDDNIPRSAERVLRFVRHAQAA